MSKTTESGNHSTTKGTFTSEEGQSKRTLTVSGPFHPGDDADTIGGLNERSSEPEGLKHDDEKLRWDLVYWPALEELVKVLMHGAKTYGDYNWQKVSPSKERYTNALMRHVIAYANGERDASDTGRHHLAHALCNCMFLMYFDKEGHNG